MRLGTYVTFVSGQIVPAFIPEQKYPTISMYIHFPSNKGLMSSWTCYSFSTTGSMMQPWDSHSGALWDVLLVLWVVLISQTFLRFIPGQFTQFWQLHFVPGKNSLSWDKWDACRENCESVLPEALLNLQHWRQKTLRHASSKTPHIFHIFPAQSRDKTFHDLHFAF